MTISEFRKQFSEATKMAKQINGDEYQLTTPRVSGRQKHRSNPPSSTPEEYYRISLCDEFLSHVVSELEVRFVNNPCHSITIGLLHLLPSECIKQGDDVIVPEDLAKVVIMIFPIMLCSTLSMIHGCSSGRDVHLQPFLTH